MTRDEFCTVVVKVIGFYLLARGVVALPTSLVSYAVNLMDYLMDSAGPTYSTVYRFTSLHPLIQIAGGYLIMLKGKTISGWLLRLGNSEV